MMADSKLARTFKSKNQIKIKTNRHRVMEKLMDFGRNITHECLLSQSVSVLSSFECSTIMSWCA